jgi:hypothetical protein
VGKVEGCKKGVHFQPVGFWTRPKIAALPGQCIRNIDSSVLSSGSGAPSDLALQK